MEINQIRNSFCQDKYAFYQDFRKKWWQIPGPVDGSSGSDEIARMCIQR